MAVPVISTIVNGGPPIATPNLDGLTCLVTLAAAPNGAPSFFVNRTPGTLGVAAFSSSLVSGTTYSVQIASTLIASRELWYITARDLNGDSAQRAVWIRPAVNDIDMNELGKYLEKQVRDNKDGIEAAMRAVYAQATVKSITYGGGWRADAGIHIAITPSSTTVSEQYWAAPFYKLDEVVFNIEGWMTHESPTYEIELITAAGRAVHMILGQQKYELTTLASGLVVSGIQGDPTQLTLFDQYDEGNERFVGGFAFTWRGEWGGGGL